MVGQAQLTRFRCEACGTLHAKWVPRCAKCGQLKVRSEITSVLSAAAAAAAAASAAEPAIVPISPVSAATSAPELAKVTAIEPPPNLPVPISDVKEESYVRYRTGLDPLDDVLGGGLVKGSLVLLSADPGGGKCLGRGTQVVMANGDVRAVETIQLGERVMGPDGRPRTVLATNTGTGQLYRIMPVKGEPWVCNDAHVLTLVQSLTGEVFDIPVSEWLAAAPHSRVRDKGKQFSVGIDRFEGFNGELPIDPYFLGLWFGDGNKEVAGDQLRAVGITKPDAEVRDACETIAKQWGLQVTTWTNDTECPTYSLTTGRTGAGEPRYSNRNPLLAAMRTLLGATLAMPTSYTRAPREQRLAFLAGLLDSDGYLNNGYFEIAQKREDWAREIWWMARSLGFFASITSCQKSCPRPDGTMFTGTYWRVTICGHTDRIPTRIPRKQAAPRQQIKDATRTGITIDAIGQGEFFGFQLDGDGRFLLGDFTVTHNSTLLAQALDGMHVKCLYATGEETVAQAAHRARRLCADSPQVLIVAETRLELVLEYAKEYKVDVLAIDSIQTLAHSDVKGSAGSLAQVRECAQRLMHFAKNTGVAVFVIAHVTHDGVIAGPKTLEHLVDTVLMLEVKDDERILRSSKNRFGATARVGRMIMTSVGLEAAPFQATEDSDDSDDSGGGGILH